MEEERKTLLRSLARSCQGIICPYLPLQLSATDNSPVRKQNDKYYLLEEVLNEAASLIFRTVLRAKKELANVSQMDIKLQKNQAHK